MMNTSGNWKTSTPLQCRQDSGHGNYSTNFLYQELSPIRKQPSLKSDTELDNVKICRYGKLHEINPKKLDFSLIIGNNCEDINTDSGLGSSINDSSEILDNKPQDGNSNFKCIYDYDAKSKSYQPSKYICRDHSHWKKLNSNKHKVHTDKSDILNYAITSQLSAIRREKRILRLDFLHELNIRNCTSIISDIFLYLSDEDIRQASNVSKEWQLIVSNDNNANKKRVAYLNNKKNASRGPNKENKFKTEISSERDHKSAFTSVFNVENENKQTLIFDNLLGRFDSFLQEMKIEGQQALMKCPKCRYPARTENGCKFSCTRNLCKHEFCKKCLGPYLDNHICSVPKLNNSMPDIIVCSKKSLKNLRRLRT